MTTTSTYKGLDPEGRSSSRVLRPPGGASSFSFGVGDGQQPQSVRRHKMASNIFGIPDDEPTPASHASETEIPVSSASGILEEKSCDTECQESADHMGEAEIPDSESGKEGCEASGDIIQSSAPVTIGNRRNPPGGKSSLILG